MGALKGCARGASLETILATLLGFAPLLKSRSGAALKSDLLLRAIYLKEGTKTQRWPPNGPIWVCRPLDKCSGGETGPKKRSPWPRGRPRPKRTQKCQNSKSWPRSTSTFWDNLLFKVYTLKEGCVWTCSQLGGPESDHPGPGPRTRARVRPATYEDIFSTPSPHLPPLSCNPLHPRPPPHTHPEPSPAQSAWLGFRPLVLSRRRPPGRNTPGSEKSALQVAGLTRRKLSEARSEFDPLSWLRLHEGWNGSEEGFPTGSGAPNLKRCPKLEKSSLFGVGPYHGPITSV